MLALYHYTQNLLRLTDFFNILISYNKKLFKKYNAV